jgi:hypothetical protein
MPSDVSHILHPENVDVSVNKIVNSHLIKNIGSRKVETFVKTNSTTLVNSLF